MSIGVECPRCGCEYDKRAGSCPVCKADPTRAVPCSYCGAIPGEPCESMARAGRPTKRPHPERRKRAREALS